MRKTVKKRISLALIIIGAFLMFGAFAFGQSSGPINTPLMNKGYYFVGTPPYQATIQSAVNAACAAGHGEVVVPPGVAPSDSPTTTSGCTQVTLLVQTSLPWACYASTGGLYSAASCTGGGGSGCGAGSCVVTNPGTSSQTIISTAGASFGLSGTQTNDAGLTVFRPDFFDCYHAGWNNGQSYNGNSNWSTCKSKAVNLMAGQTGIAQAESVFFDHPSGGDTADHYGYMNPRGDGRNGNDEFVVGYEDQIFQFPTLYGPATSGGTGLSNVAVTGPSCAGSGCGTQHSFNWQQFGVGSLLVNNSQSVTTCTILTYDGVVNGALRYTLSGSCGLTTSTATGTIASCSANGLQGKWGMFGALTCIVNVLTGSFVSSTNIERIGAHTYEEATNITVTGSGATQTITMQAMFPFSAGDFIGQGGNGGQSFTKPGGTIGASYFIGGVPDSTHIYFANPTPQGNGGNVIKPSAATTPANLNRNGTGTVTATPSGFNLNVTQFPTQVVVTGAVPSDLNGTFTVTSNNLDNINPVLQWAQGGSAETSTTPGTLTDPLPQFTIYQSALVCGTGFGTIGTANLCPNHMLVNTSDVLVNAEATEYSQRGATYILSQDTPPDDSYPSQGVNVSAPSFPIEQTFVASNVPANGQADSAFKASGSYQYPIHLKYRPALNGTVIQIDGLEPMAGSTAKCYFLYGDNASQLQMRMCPSDASVQMFYSTFTANVLKSNAPSVFPSGTTIGGQNPCLQNGANCPAAAYTLGGTLANGNCAISGGTSITSCTLSGLDGNHQVSFVTGSSAPPTGTILTVTFTATRGHTTYPLLQSATTSFLTSPGGSATSYVINTSGTLATSTTYNLNVSAP